MFIGLGVMPPKLPAVVGGAVASIVLVSACSPQPSAAPVESSQTPSTASGATDGSAAKSPTSAVDTRPREIDLRGLDPCTAVPADTLAGLGYRRSSVGQKRAGVTALACDYPDVTGIEGTTLFFDAAEGYQKYSQSAPGNDVEPVKIMGYMAYSVQDQRLGGCTVAVDVADLQSLSTSSSGPQADPVAPLCDKAAEFAAAAITALTSK